MGIAQVGPPEHLATVSSGEHLSTHHRSTTSVLAKSALQQAQGGAMMGPQKS